MQDQEICLREFPEDSRIARNDPEGGRRTAFAAMSGDPTKMSGSLPGAETAAGYGTIGQTERAYTPNTRADYKDLTDRMFPFVREKMGEDPHAAFPAVEEMRQFPVWSPEYRQYA